MPYSCVYRYLHKGDFVEVYTDDEMSMYLMDLFNYRRYEAGKPHSKHGGRIKHSPGRLKVPETGSWYVVIESPSKGAKYTLSIV